MRKKKFFISLKTQNNPKTKEANMSNNRHRHTEKTLKVLNALAYTDAWRPAGSNHLWTETYPFESGLTNMEIFEQNKFCRFESEKSFCTKDGMIKGAVPCLENMDKRLFC